MSLLGSGLIVLLSFSAEISVEFFLIAFLPARLSLSGKTCYQLCGFLSSEKTFFLSQNLPTTLRSLLQIKTSTTISRVQTGRLLFNPRVFCYYCTHCFARLISSLRVFYYYISHCLQCASCLTQESFTAESHIVSHTSCSVQETYASAFNISCAA